MTKKSVSCSLLLLLLLCVLWCNTSTSMRLANTILRRSHSYSYSFRHSCSHCNCYSVSSKSYNFDCIKSSFVARMISDNFDASNGSKSDGMVDTDKAVADDSCGAVNGVSNSATDNFCNVLDSKVTNSEDVEDNSNSASVSNINRVIVETELPPKLKRVHHTTITIIPNEAETTVWEQLRVIRTTTKDKGLYRWPPHINIIYPFIDIKHISATIPFIEKSLVNFNSFELLLSNYDVFGGKDRGVLWLDVWYNHNNNHHNNHNNRHNSSDGNRLQKNVDSITNIVDSKIDSSSNSTILSDVQSASHSALTSSIGDSDGQSEINVRKSSKEILSELYDRLCHCLFHFENGISIDDYQYIPVKYRRNKFKIIETSDSNSNSNSSSNGNSNSSSKKGSESMSLDVDDSNSVTGNNKEECVNSGNVDDTLPENSIDSTANLIAKQIALLSTNVHRSVNKPFRPHLTVAHYDNIAEAIKVRDELNIGFEPIRMSVSEIYICTRRGDDGQFCMEWRIPLREQSDSMNHNNIYHTRCDDVQTNNADSTRGIEQSNECSVEIRTAAVVSRAVFERGRRFIHMPEEEEDWIKQLRMDGKKRNKSNRRGNNSIRTDTIAGTDFNKNRIQSRL